MVVPPQTTPGVLEPAPGEFVGPIPHARKRRLVGKVDDGIAEGPTQRILLALHLDAEKPLEDRVGDFLFAVAAHRLGSLHFGHPGAEDGRNAADRKGMAMDRVGLYLGISRDEPFRAFGPTG
jgi:hypothetical protein